MKKIFILIMVLSVALVAESLKVKTACYSRVSDSSLESAGWVKAGETFTILEKTGAWYFVKVEDGVNAGKEKWVWRELIANGVVKNKGCKAYDKPVTGSEPFITLEGGTKVTLIKPDVKWYKVADKKWLYYLDVEVTN